MPSPFEAELSSVVGDYKRERKRSQCNDLSDVLLRMDTIGIEIRCLAAIERAAGRNSVYFEQAEAILAGKVRATSRLVGLVGIADSLLANIKAGYIRTLEELVHGELFGDFLEMAQYLLDTNSKYKDAAAVVCGSTLEVHLKQLCKKVGIATDVGGKPKKTETLNGELAGASIYSKLDQKNVTAWLGLRNSAAHGDYTAYDGNQVGLMIAAVRDFITRVPA